MGGLKLLYCCIVHVGHKSGCWATADLDTCLFRDAFSLLRNNVEPAAFAAGEFRTPARLPSQLKVAVISSQVFISFLPYRQSPSSEWISSETLSIDLPALRRTIFFKRCGMRHYRAGERWYREKQFLHILLAVQHGGQ